MMDEFGLRFLLEWRLKGRRTKQLDLGEDRTHILAAFANLSRSKVE